MIFISGEVKRESQDCQTYDLILWMQRKPELWGEEEWAGQVSLPAVVHRGQLGHCLETLRTDICHMLCVANYSTLSS